MRVLAVVHQRAAGPGVFGEAIRDAGGELDEWTWRSARSEVCLQACRLGDRAWAIPASDEISSCAGLQSHAEENAEAIAELHLAWIGVR